MRYARSGMRSRSLGHATGQDAVAHACVRARGDARGGSLAVPSAAVPCAAGRSPRQMHPSAVQTARSWFPPFAACFAIAPGARREPGGRRWGRGRGWRRALLYRGQRAASQPGFGQTPACPGSVPRGRWLPYFRRADAGGTFHPFAPSPSHRNAAAPGPERSRHHRGVPAAPLAGVWGGPSPTRTPRFGPHPPRKRGWGHWHTQAVSDEAEQRFVLSPISPQHRKAVESPDLRCDKR